MKVLVTGANGHLGRGLLSALLAAGHTVRASVRDASDEAKLSRVRLPGVEVVEADLARPAQLRAAMDGMDLVFHAAAVYAYHAPGREQEIMDASVKGAEAALRSAADARVRKLVLTSSAVTLPLTVPGAPPSTEADWTTDLRVPYIRAKVEAERLAWRLAEELRLNLVTVLPGSIAGPGYDKPTPSIDVLEVLMCNGFRMGCPHSNLPYVDVRDVAAAHVLAGEQDVQGRFAVVNDELPSFERILEAMRAIDPRVKPPLTALPDALVPAMPLFDWLNAKVLGTPRIASRELLASLRGKRWNVSNQRARAVLGWQPRIPFETSLRETMVEMRRRRESRVQVAPAAASA